VSTAIGAPGATDQVPEYDDEPRRVKLTLTRVNAFSVMKISFLISVGLGIAGVVLVTVLWTMLNGMGVFQQINDAVSELPSGAGNARMNISDYLSLGRVLSASIVFGVVDVFLLTAMSTLLALIYNLCAALVGGVRVTLSDE
jgi:transmembrane protein DUF3566